jgi:hypothetical protein
MEQRKLCLASANQAPLSLHFTNGATHCRATAEWPGGDFTAPAARGGGQHEPNVVGAVGVSGGVQTVVLRKVVLRKRSQQLQQQHRRGGGTDGGHNVHAPSHTRARVSKRLSHLKEPEGWLHLPHDVRKQALRRGVQYGGRASAEARRQGNWDGAWATRRHPPPPQ